MAGLSEELEVARAQSANEGGECLCACDCLCVRVVNDRFIPVPEPQKASSNSPVDKEGMKGGTGKDISYHMTMILYDSKWWRIQDGKRR